MNAIRNVGSAVVLLAAVTTSHARTLDALGHCPNGARMVQALGPFKGKADTALSDAQFARAHAAGTSGQPRWLAELSGASGNNRVFVDGQVKVLVLAVCEPANCDRVRGYVAYDPTTVVWGASVYFNGQVQELGKPIVAGAETQVMPTEVAKAVICAQTLDWGNQR